MSINTVYIEPDGYITGNHGIVKKFEILYETNAAKFISVEMAKSHDDRVEIISHSDTIIGIRVFDNKKPAADILFTGYNYKWYIWSATIRFHILYVALLGN